MKRTHAEAGIVFERLAEMFALDANEQAEIAQMTQSLLRDKASAKVSYGTEAGFFQRAGIPSIVDMAALAASCAGQTCLYCLRHLDHAPGIRVERYFYQLRLASSKQRPRSSIQAQARKRPSPPRGHQGGCADLGVQSLTGNAPARYESAAKSRKMRGPLFFQQPVSPATRGFNSRPLVSP
jgi:hypothetical protein